MTAVQLLAARVGRDAKVPGWSAAGTQQELISGVLRAHRPDNTYLMEVREIGSVIRALANRPCEFENQFTLF